MTISAAVIGTGMIGRIHARAVRACGARLAAVVDVNADVAAQKALQLHAERSSTSAQEVFTAPDIDVVHICVPNHLHAQLVREAVAAGKHVVCEKPLAVTAGEAAELVRLAEAAGVVTAVPFSYRYNASTLEARARVQRGDLGELRLLQGHYLQDWLVEPGAYNWRVDSRLGGASRAFADIGSHLVDVIEFVSGHRIVELTADTKTAVPARVITEGAESFSAAKEGGTTAQVTTEDIASVLFRTDRGAVGTLLVSQVSPGRKNQLWFELDGARQSVIFDQDHPEQLAFGRGDGMHIMPRDPAQFSTSTRRYAHLPAGHPQGLQDCFDALVSDAYDTIGGAVIDTLPTFRDGWRAAVLTDTVMASARTRGWLPVPEVG